MNFAMVLRTATAGAWLIFATSTCALAQGAAVSLGATDTNGPTEIFSDTAQLDAEQNIAIFSGGVIITQGDATITAEKVIAEFSDDTGAGRGNISVIRASGGVTIVSSEEATEAENAVYNVTTSTVVMTGNVLVTQGAVAMSADSLTYNLDTGSGQLQGNVKTVLQQANN